MNESDRYAFIEMYEKINTVRKQYANIEFSGEMVPTIVSIGKYNIGSILDEIDYLSESNKERFTSEITYFSNALEDLVNSKSREDFDYILKTVDSLYNELAELANIEKDQDLEDHNNNDKVEIYNKSLENYKKHTKEYLQNKKKYEKGEISFEEYQDFYKNLNNEYIELLEFYQSIENKEGLELPKKPTYSSKKPEDLGVDDLVSKIAQYQKHYDVHESLYHEFNDLQDSYRKLSDVEKIERYAEYEKKALEVISSQAYTQEEYDKLKTFYEAVEKAFDEANKDNYAASPDGLKTFQEEIVAYNESIKKYTEEYIILEELASKLEENEGLRAEYEEQLTKVSSLEAELSVKKAILSAKKISILNVNTYKRTEMNIHLIEAHLKLKNVTEEERLELEEKLKNLKNALKEMDIIKSTVKIKTIKKVSKIGVGRSQEKPKDPDEIEISGVHTPHKKTSSPFDDVAEPDKIDGYDKKPEEIIDPPVKHEELKTGLYQILYKVCGDMDFSQKDGRKYTASHVKVFQPLHSEKEKLDHDNGGIGQEWIKYHVIDPLARGVRGIFAGTARFFTKMWGLTLKKTQKDVIDEMQERAMALTDEEVKILLEEFHTETSREIRIPYVVRDALIRRIEIYCDKMIPYYQNYQEYLISEIKAIEAELENAKDVNLIGDLISRKSRLIEEHWKIRGEFDSLQKEEEAFRSSQNAAKSHRNYYGGVFEKVPDYNPELLKHIANLEWQILNGTPSERETAIVELDNLKRKNTITNKKWYHNFGQGISAGAFDVRDKVQKLNYDKNTFYTDLNN